MQVLGIPELSAKLLTMVRVLTDSEGYRIFLVAARALRDPARRNVPRREGKLEKAIVARSAPRRKGRPPAAFALVNLFRGSARAPHGHLIHFGTQERRPKRGKFLVFTDKRSFGLRKWDGSGFLVFARKTRPVRAVPFFTDAVRQSGAHALDQAAAATQRLIEKAAKPVKEFPVQFSPR